MNMVRHKIKTVFLIAFFILLCAAEAFADADGKVVRIGFYPIPGLQDIGKNGKLTGYMYDYLQDIAQITDWKCEFVAADFDTCYRMLSSGKIDFMGGMQKTPQREKQFEFPNYPCGTMYVAMYVKSSNKKYVYDDVASFQGMTVGVLGNLAGNKDMVRYLANHNVTVKLKKYNFLPELKHALSAGDVDAICVPSANLKENYRCIASFDYKNFYLMAAKGRGGLVKELDRALEQIKIESPFYEQLLWARHFKTRQESSPNFTKKELNYIKNSGVINVVYNKSWIPIERYNEKTKRFDGVNAQVFALISKLSGLKFNYLPEDGYTRAYKLLSHKDVQMICSTANNYAWAEKYNMKLSREYLNIPAVLITNDIDAASNATVAMPKDFYLTSKVRGDFPNYKYIEYDNYADCLEAITKGEATITFTNSLLAREYISSAKYSKLNVIALNGYNISYSIGFSRDVNNTLVSVINKTLACITDDQINSFIIDDTMKYRQISAMDLVHQNPGASVLVLSLFFGIFIVLLSVALFGRIKYAKQLYKMVNIDPLTGTPSYNKFLTDARKLLSSEKHGRYLLIYLNITKFKNINDIYGYSIGDKVLRFVCEALKSYLPAGSIFARINSDRFVALTNYMNRETFEPWHDAFLKTLSQPRANIPCRLLVYVGACEVGEGENDVNVLVDRASYAENECRSDRKAKFVFYDDNLKQKIITEHSLERDMEIALRSGEFKVYYQPKINSESGETEGAEALIRWQHPRYGLLQPASFIPLFEMNMFIVQTDWFVCRETCKYIASRRAAGKTVFPISCNFSRRHLSNPKLAEQLESIVREYDLEPSLLEVELTETIAATGEDILKQQLDNLKARGFNISVDDFGAGYSSLALLSNIPSDIIKLDRGLITNAITDSRKKQILAGIVSIILSLGKKIVCEGVEDQEQIGLLKSLKCYTIQGYFYSRPMPQSEFDKKY